MNWPNRLTVLRVLLVPALVVVMYIDALYVKYNFMDKEYTANFVALAIFAVASLTDFLDGYLARKYNLVTTFGKFMDPLADKLLTTAAILVFLEQGLFEAWIPIVIISREYIVSGVRLVASSKGTVIAAGQLGKLKTVTTMIALIILFLGFNFIGWIVMLVAAGLTIVSGLEYLIKNGGVILESI